MESRRVAIQRVGRAIEVHFPGEIDDAHATAAELAVDRVAAGERRLEREEERIDGIAGPGHAARYRFGTESGAWRMR